MQLGCIQGLPGPGYWCGGSHWCGGSQRGEGGCGGGRAEVEGQAVPGRKLSKDWEDEGEGRETVRSPGRKPNVFAGREVGEGGKARTRKRKRGSEPWGSRTEHTDGLPKSGRRAEGVLVSQEG